jgi:coiled-coil domain-containing protein 130
VIRFEMPFNVWCEGCSSHIGKGVRYNAEKKKVGNYYTTPIYSFTMKCHLCPQKFVIETDPKECDYKLVSGVKKKNEKWDPESTNVIPLPDDEEKKRMETDPMFRLEHIAEVWMLPHASSLLSTYSRALLFSYHLQDEKVANERVPSLQRLIQLQEGTKKDYDLNSLLRKDFRAKRKELQAAENEDKALLKRASLDIKLLPAEKTDIAIAKAITYDSQKGVDPRPMCSARLFMLF